MLNHLNVNQFKIFVFCLIDLVYVSYFYRSYLIQINNQDNNFFTTQQCIRVSLIIKNSFLGCLPSANADESKK